MKKSTKRQIAQSPFIIAVWCILLPFKCPRQEVLTLYTNVSTVCQLLYQRKQLIGFVLYRPKGLIYIQSQTSSGKRRPPPSFSLIII